MASKVSQVSFPLTFRLHRRLWVISTVVLVFLNSQLASNMAAATELVIAAPLNSPSAVTPAPSPTSTPVTTTISPVAPSQPGLPSSLKPSGPGGRIFGLDISRYQHSPTTPINFAKMASAGVSFLWINGGNTLSDADSLAASYYEADRPAAQAQGIYTGFYYYVHLPNSTKRSVIIANADNQANKVINRINADGGLDNLDMPVALDIESTCTKTIVFGICTKHMSTANTVAWVRKWVNDLHAATGHNPVIYSFLSLLHGSLSGANSLVINPLWVSTAGISANAPGSQPAQLKGGCSTNVWTSQSCTMQWTLWQYSSGGNGRTFGIPAGNVDQDIFAGSATDFLNFAATGLEAPVVPPVISSIVTSSSGAH